MEEDSLSDEIWNEVFSWLDAVDLARVSQVCQRFQRLGQHDALWRPVVNHRWNLGRELSKLEHLNGSDFKSAYVYLRHTVPANWRRGNGKSTKMLAHTKPIWDVKASERYVVTGSHDKTAQVWDPSSNELLHTLAGHTRKINAIDLHADGDLLVSASTDTTVRLWQPSTGREVHTFTDARGSVICTQLNPSAALALAGSHDRNLYAWDLETGACTQTFAGHTGAILKVVVYSPNIVATSSFDKTVRVWDLVSGEEVSHLRAHVEEVPCLAGQEGQPLVSGSYDGSIRMWDLRTCSGIALEGHTNSVRCLDVKAGVIVSASHDNTVRVWDASTGLCRHIGREHTDWVRNVQIIPLHTGPIAVSGGRDGYVVAMDTTTGRVLFISGDADDSVHALHACESILATARKDSLEITDFKFGEQIEDDKRFRCAVS